MKVHAINLDVSKRNVKKHLSHALEISCSNAEMDIFENRRRWLAYWIANDFGGDRKRAEESTGYSRSQLAQFLSSTYQDGESPGERAARNIEKKFKKPARIMETAAPAGSEFPPLVASAAPTQAVNASSASATIESGLDQREEALEVSLTARDLRKGGTVDFSVWREMVQTILDEMDATMGDSDTTRHDAFAVMRIRLIAGLDQMASILGQRDQFTGAFRALIEAQAEGISDFEIAPVRHVIETMVKIKRSAGKTVNSTHKNSAKKAKVASVQPMNETSSGSKSDLVNEGKGAVKDAFKALQDKDLRDHDVPTGTRRR